MSSEEKKGLKTSSAEKKPSDNSKMGRSKTEDPKMENLKTDSSKTGDPKIDSPKASQSKTDRPKDSHPKAESSSKEKASEKELKAQDKPAKISKEEALSQKTAGAAAQKKEVDETKTEAVLSKGGDSKTEGSNDKKSSADKKASPSDSADKKDSGSDKPKIKKTSKEPVKLKGLFAFKMSMSRFYNEKGESLPVTALKYEPAFVSQIKTEEKDSYSAVQVAFKAQKNKRCSKAVIQRLKPAGFKEGARFIKEIRQTVPENIKLGDELSIHSLEKGDLVRISSLSKGKGFTGVMKRWNFGGGRASHGSKAHRRTGSIGQHTQPGRVFPGRKMPGRHGFQKVSCLKVPVVEVLPEEGIIFVKGPVPGARNALVSLQKM